MRLLIKFFKKAVDVFYPRRCLHCRKIITSEYFCHNCEDVAAYIIVKTCPECGLPRKYCECKWNFYYFDEIISCFESTEETKNSFYSFKFGGNRIGGKFFALEMGRRINNHPFRSKIDVITSVPSHKDALRQRGYDQVKVLAKNISKITNIEYSQLLNQPKQVPKQHETTGISERFQNVLGKYRVIKNKDIKDKTVLLVDDIKTTGATLSQCARELKLAGAKKVVTISALTVYPKKEDKLTENTINLPI